MRETPQAAVDLIKHFEGLHKIQDEVIVPYRDAAGFWTIGYGHLMTRKREVNPYPNGLKWKSISEIYADGVLLRKDLKRSERGVLRLINVPLTDGQFGALVSFAFNLGLGSLQASTLRKKVNAREHDEVPYQLSRWCFAGGRKLRGLAIRRAAEAELYMSSI